MNRGKMMSLLFAAIVAVAFAAPAAASATNWSYQQEAIEEDRYIELDGTIGQVNFFECEVEGEAVLFAGTNQGQLLTLEANACVGNGSRSVCKTELTEASTPAPVQATQSSNVEISDLDLTVEYSGPYSICSSVPTVTFQDTTLIGAPDAPEAISTLTLSGSAKFFNTTITGFYGELDVSPPGVFGIQQ